MTTATGRRTPPLDAQVAAALELARGAAVQAAEGAVGDHVGVEADADRVATHLFGCTDPAYRGWRWAVTVARAARAQAVTVNEIVLLPGPDALLAPPWVPWSDRLRPGDLGVGDLLPTEEDDDRLVPAYASGEDAQADEVAWELGLGRVRVLSPVGREEAVGRWYDGEAGPTAPISRAAPDRCGTCGFLVPLAGGLRQLFGACANEFAPDDGRVVALDHGCGAHSEAVVVASVPEPAPPTLDEFSYDEMTEQVPSPQAGPGHPVGSVDDGESAESLGHS